MANARKCDVCGNLYEHYKGNSLFSNHNGLNQSNAITMIDRNTENKYWNRKTYDLCPECMDKLEKFLKAGGDNDDL